MRRLLELPLLVLLMAIAALSMWLPAVHGVVVRDHETARAFFYSGVILLILFLREQVLGLGALFLQQAHGYGIGFTGVALSCMSL